MPLGDSDFQILIFIQRSWKLTSAQTSALGYLYQLTWVFIAAVLTIPEHASSQNALGCLGEHTNITQWPFFSTENACAVMPWRDVEEPQTHITEWAKPSEKAARVQYMTFWRTQRYNGDSKTINSGQEFRMREGWKVVTKTTWGNGNSLNEDVMTKSLYICSDPWPGWGQEWIRCGSVVVATVSLR